MASRSQLRLLIVTVPPMTNAKFVHGIQVKDPIQNERCVTKECCIGAHHPAGDGFDKAEEHDPAERRRLNSQSLEIDCELVVDETQARLNQR